MASDDPPILVCVTYAAAFVNAEDALHTGIRIVIIIVVAVATRFLMHRAVRRLTKRTGDGKVPVMLRPLKGRAKEAAVRATGLLAERRRQRSETIRSVLQSVISIVIGSIAVILVLGELGINLAPIIASAGIAGVALGFGAQSLVKDYLNGISMILEDQYGVGDIVDLGEASGTIEAVGLRTTRVRDAEGVIWYVRNGEIIRVGNSSQGTATVIVDMPVAHGIDIEHAQSLMTSVLAEMANDPELADTYVQAPEVLGVQTVTALGMTLRAILTTIPGARYSAARIAKQRLASAFAGAGIKSPATMLPTSVVSDPVLPTEDTPK